MKFRKAFIVICLIICLFTMASAFAGDANDNNTITATDLEDNHVIEKTEVIFDDSLNDSSEGPKNDNVEISAPKLGAYDENQLGADLKANVIPINVSVADNTLFVIDCPDDFNGNVSIKTGSDLLYNGSVKIIIDAGKLNAGDYTATVVFYGDSNYKDLTLNDINFTVSRVTPSIDVSISDITYPASAYAIINLGNNANGTVNVTIDKRTFKGNVRNGYVSVELTDLSAGSKEAMIEFFSDDDYNNDVWTIVKFTILPNNSLVMLKVEKTFHVGEDIEMNITTYNSTGDIKIYINGAFYNTLHYAEGPTHIVVFSGLDEGTYTVTVSLDGDRNYTQYSTSLGFDVVKNDLSINLNDVGEITVDSPVTFTATLSESVTGNVIFNINGNNYTVRADNENTVTYKYIPVDNTNLTVFTTFAGNAEYLSNVSETKIFEVERITTSIDVSFNSVLTAGDDARISITMNESVNGIVELNVGVKQYYVAIADGCAETLIQNLCDGDYEINATFYGDKRYNASTSEAKKLVVNNVITNLSISINKNSMSHYDFATVSVELQPSINAIVTVKVNGQNNTVGLVNGKGNIVLYDLLEGNYIITAVFAGDDKYVQRTSNSLNLTVTGDNITTPVSIDINKPSVFVGDKVLIKLNLKSTVNGIVKLNIGSDSYNVVVNKGVGIFTIDDLANGTYDVQAIFDGDTYHHGNSSDVKRLEVKKIPISLSVSINNPSVVVGDKVIIAVNSNSTVTGVIRLNIGSDSYDMVVNNGVGNLTVYNLVKGTYNVWAAFDGDDKYLGNVSDVKQLEVNKISTSLSFTMDKSSVYAGDEVIVSVNLNQSVSGIIKLNVGSKSYNVALRNGVGTFTIAESVKGTYDVWAAFDGDDKYSGDVSDVKQLNVNNVPSNLSVSIDNALVYVGDSVVVSVVLNHSINNVVTVNVNDKNYIVGIVNGKGNLTLTDLTYGTYTVNAVFAGEGKYIGCVSDNVTFEVNKFKTVLSGDAVAATYNVAEYLTVSLKDSNGNAIRSAEVTVDLNGVKTFVTDNNGQIKVSTNALSPKTYTAKITFKGNAVYEGSLKYVGVTVKKANPKIIAKTETFKLKVKTKKYSVTLNNNVAKAIGSAKLFLKVNGKTYQATTNANGKATFKIKNLNKKGTYNAVITFNGNAFYNKVTQKVKIKV